MHHVVNMRLALVHEEYRVLDVMKFVMAIVVVAIHTRPELSFSSLIVRNFFEAVYSIAVPFFFMASGFLLFRKISLPLTDEGELRIKSYLKRMCKLYVLWTIVYLPLTIYGFYLDGISPLKTVVVFFRNFLLVGENYMSWPLWYLLALIVAVSIIYILLKLKVSKGWIVIISIMMALIGVGLDYCKENSLMSQITDLYFTAFLKTRNGFFVGFLYVALGMFLSKLGRISVFGPILLFVLGVVGMSMKLPLSNALIVCSIFIFSISCVEKKITHDNSVVFRMSSSIIYFVHMIFMAGFVIAFGFDKSFSLFSLVTILSVCTGVMLLNFRNSKAFYLFFN